MPHSLLSRILGFRRPRFPLDSRALPIVDLPQPATLSLTMTSVSPGGERGDPCRVRVKKGVEVTPGDVLGECGGGQIMPSPVAGKVVAVADMPDLRGGRWGTSRPSILIEPSDATSQPAFPKLNPDKSDLAALKERVQAAGVLTDEVHPRRLVDALAPSGQDRLQTVVVLAADREPELSGTLQLFRDRKQDVAAAARLMGKLAGVDKVAIAVIDSVAGEASSLSRESVTVLSLPPEYPESLEPLVALRAGPLGTTRVIGLETALAALDAVRDGRVQRTKIVTIIERDGTAITNLRVPLGTRVRDLLEHVELKPYEAEKIVVGGPMRGFAQHALDVSIDAGVDAVALIPRARIIDWSDEPCINCGKCTDICPVQLQIQLINRYSEFGLFDRTQELEIEQCIECGLCATVCTARRPLVQLIRLAKQELQLAATSGA